MPSARTSHGLSSEILEFRQKLCRNHANLVYQDPTQIDASVEQQSGVSLATLFAYLVPLLVSERDAAPMVDGVTADVGSHRILYCQAYELASILPAEHVSEKLADPRDDFAFASAGVSVNHIENWLDLCA